MSEFDHKQIDDVIHGRVRLAIMAYLASVEESDFGLLKSTVNVSDGNLSTHLRKLEEAGYLQVEKGFQGRRPQTLCRLTDQGRKAFSAYISHLESLIPKAPPGT